MTVSYQPSERMLQLLVCCGNFKRVRMEIKTLKDKEKELLYEVLAKTHWDLQKTSRLLKISLPQVKRKIRKHGIQAPDSS